jgi:hypothetical protein
MSVADYTELLTNGYTITYTEGDVCDPATNKRYSSEVKYICNFESEEFGWPQFVQRKGCHYAFEWKSKLACS